MFIVTISAIARMSDASDVGHAGTLQDLVLRHDERHIRRRVLRLADGRRALFDLAEPTLLSDGDVLELDDGERVRIVAADEDLYELRGSNQRHLAELAWHIGNRHLPAEIAADAIRILRDHVIRAMLEGLGACVTEFRGPFAPMRGAYAGAGGAAHHH